MRPTESKEKLSLPYSPRKGACFQGKPGEGVGKLRGGRNLLGKSKIATIGEKERSTSWQHVRGGGKRTQFSGLMRRWKREGPFPCDGGGRKNEGKKARERTQGGGGDFLP